MTAITHSTPADGTFSAEGAAAWDAEHVLQLWTEIEHDFGTSPVYDAVLTITDAAITAASTVVVQPCGKAATGRTADDWQWDGATFAANPGDGVATVYAVFWPGPVVGPRKLQYQIGA